MISQQLQNEFKTQTWKRYSQRESAWSFYQTELSRIKTKFANGFKTRNDVLNVLDDSTEDENLWNFFCAVMFWGACDEKYFNEFKEQKDQIILNIRSTIENFSNNPNIEEAHKLWRKPVTKIKGLDISFFSKILYFIGYKYKNKFADCPRPFIYDAVMTKNLAYIFLDSFTQKDELNSELVVALNITNFKFKKETSKQINSLTPKTNYKSYIAFCTYLTKIYDSLKLDKYTIDDFDEIIFGVNSNTENINQGINFRDKQFRDSNNDRLQNLIEVANDIINKKATRRINK